MSSAQTEHTVMIPAEQQNGGDSLRPAEDGVWKDSRMIDDPEEERVIFNALDSFSQYGKVAHFNVTHLRRQSFYALPQSQWQMLARPPFNFLETLSRVDDAIDTNAELSSAIVQSGLRSFGLMEMPRLWKGASKHGDIDKARSTIRQFYRDWTADGAKEREASYAPIIKALESERHKHGKTQLNVLVPGAGLGRLVFDLCVKGYEVEGNEISYHQLLASSYILNECTSADQFTIFPWVHTFSNHRSRENHLRSYAVPDIHPASVLQAAGENAGSMCMCAADFLCLYGDNDHKNQYDAVASVFFLDTAPNLTRYLEVIWSCLRPGGALINIGPLLWHFENNAPGNHGKDDDGDGEHDSNNSSGIADPGSFELSEDEVLALIEKVGFVMEWKEHGIETPYIQDRDSMLLTTYKSSAWVARKPKSV